MPTHDQVAHAWAHQTGSDQDGHYMFYRGRAIYSYSQHFRIASLIDTPAGVPAVLLTTGRYGISTAKHLSIVRRAGAHLLTFTVPFNAETLYEQQHLLNLAHYISRINDALAKASRARTHGALHLGDAQRLVDEHNRYIAAFQLTAAPAA